MTHEERMEWMLEGGWIAATALIPFDHAQVVEWTREGWETPLKASFNGLNRAVNLHGLYWRQLQKEDKAMMDKEWARQAAPQFPGSRRVRWVEDIGGQRMWKEAQIGEASPPSPSYTPIRQVWHSPSGQFFALDDNGRIWLEMTDGWGEVKRYPPGCDPNGDGR